MCNVVVTTALGAIPVLVTDQRGRVCVELDGDGSPVQFSMAGDKYSAGTTTPIRARDAIHDADAYHGKWCD